MSSFSKKILHPMLLSLLSLFVILRASQIEDCCCDTETVKAVNQEFLNEILTVIRKRTFFRIFKVDIYKACKLWPDNSLCFKPTCAVQECCEEDIPQKWRDLEFQNENNLNKIDLFLPQEFDQWDEIDEDQWVSYSENKDSMIYIDLIQNQDGYTGYKGEEAGKVWRAIYEAKNCLYDDLNINQTNKKLYETEERVLFRLISGFHTLTTCMVFANWPLPHNPNQYGPNLKLYQKVLHPHPEWIENLYFDFVFLLRAMNKASDVIRNYDYHTGNPSDDAMTMGLINYLLNTKFIKEQCDHRNSFDESTMFKNDNVDEGQIIMNNFRKVFRNISEIMDCVGCEKCKLHAKLELLGLGTALKILFTKDILTADMFERNELLSLIVTLGKYSDALQFIEDMEQEIELNKLKHNIHGFVDIDNQYKNTDDVSKNDINKNIDYLILNSFEKLFKMDNSTDCCKQWKSFCTQDLNDNNNQHELNQDIYRLKMATNICNVFEQNCV